MLEIKPIQTKEEQKRICEMCGVEYFPDDMAYFASEGDKLLGVCQFNMKGGRGYISNMSNAIGVDDFEAMFIMARQTLNFIDLCGVHGAVYLGEESRLSKAVGFKNVDGELFMDLTGFFESPCKHEY